MLPRLPNQGLFLITYPSLRYAGRMQSEHEITPLDEGSSRQIWVGWGCSLVCVALAYFVGGSFGPFLLLFIGITTALRGHKPGLFIKHIDAQIILATPYRREESWRSWILAVVACVSLAFSASWIYKKIVPAKPDVATTILKGVQELLKKQPPTVLPYNTPPAQTVEPSKPGATKYPPRTFPTQPQEPATPKAVPNPNCQRLEMGPDRFRDCSNEQVGEWAIEEAEKIRNLAIKYMPPDSKQAHGQAFIFSNIFRETCAQDVKDIRAEILRRLGPPAKDPDEDGYWRSMFHEPPMSLATPSSRLYDVDPASVYWYAPYLEKLGLELKRHDIPRAAPMALHYSEAQIAPAITGYPLWD